jgi:hypothetical protein
MRTFTKITATSLIVAGGLLVAACGHKDNAATADTNMTNMDTMDSSAGMSNDQSAMDAAGNDATAGSMGGDANGMAPAADATGNASNGGNAM